MKSPPSIVPYGVIEGRMPWAQPNFLVNNAGYNQYFSKCNQSFGILKIAFGYTPDPGKWAII